MGFRFKQFTIEDDACGMKVGTDSIMLGSWVQTQDAQRILDIGTGSGLLSIMLAQKAQDCCLLDAIDIDAAAIEQAKNNANHCPWTQRLTFYQTSLQQFAVASGYDLIVSNPPYFPINISANKPHPVTNRPNARQTLTLDHPTLLQEVEKHLATDGRFYCVLPVDVAKEFSTDAEFFGLYCTRELLVQAKPQKQVSRVLLELSRSQQLKTSEQMSIYGHSGGYSKEYIALCKDYYLNF